MKNILLLIYFTSIGLGVSAQGFITPDSGVHWNLDSLIAHSPATVSLSNNIYQVAQDFTVAENDTLTLNVGATIHIDEDVRITTQGAFYSIGTAGNEIVITASDSLTPYDGFRFEDSSKVEFDYTILKNGGGLKVITPHFSIAHSTIAYNVSGVSTGAVISLSHGSPTIQDNTFFENELPAVSSPANNEVAARIIDNIIEKNSQSNQNRPQINMGTTGSDTLIIIGNTITGDRDLDKVGGIAVSNLLGTGNVIARIEDNLITDNRYGITIAGANAYAMIKTNIIENNDTQGNPDLGGSGISLNAPSNTQTIIATGNEIRNNLWGVTIIDQASINLGDDIDNPGNNVFSNNGNNSVIYALYNNTSNTILAKHNCWIEGQANTLSDADSVIFDQADDANLGEVIYDPVGCGTVSLVEYSENNVSIYPNPARDKLNFTAKDKIDQITILSLDGKQVLKTQLKLDQDFMSIKLKSGVYIVQFQIENKQVNKKLIVE